MKRVCKKCGVEKEIEEFVKSKQCKHGYTRCCKKCKCKYVRSRKITYKTRARNRARNKRYNKSTKGKECAIKRQRKIVALLSDTYVKKVIWRHSGLKHKDITPQMVELKRELIIFHRLKKEVLNGINSGGNQRTQAHGQAA